MAGKSRPTVAVCSVAQSNVRYEHFISVLKEQYGLCVKYVHISSSILENGHDFSQYDGVVLIHSVFQGRMSLTDVKDARYEKLLLHWKSLLGSDSVAVIVTGVERTKYLEEHLKEKQPTVSKCAAHVLFCKAGDPMKDDHVTKKMESFVTLLPYRPKARKQLAQPSKATPKLGEDNNNNETLTINNETLTINNETLTITAKEVKCAGIDVKNSTIQDAKGKAHVELIICAEGSTRETLLKTLSDDDLKEEADFLIFQQKADAWELLEAGSITSFDPSSELAHCAVFIYRNGVTPNFTEDDFKSFEEIINGRTSPTDIEVSGKTDESCLQQLLKVFLECTYNDHIVTVSPGGLPTASAPSGNQTQREREHRYEATLKKEARDRIQKLNRAIRTLKQEVSCEEDELFTCKENIRVKQCEQKQIANDVEAIHKTMDGKYEELQSFNVKIKKAEQKLNETRKEFQTEENAVRRLKRDLKQIQVEKEQVSKELNSYKMALGKAKQEQKQIANDIDAIQKDLVRKKRDLQSLNENTEKAQHKLNETRRGLQTEDNAWRARREQKQIHEKKEQGSKDRDGYLRKTTTQLNDMEIAVREAEYQIQQQSLEISSWDDTLQKQIDHLNQIQEKIEEESRNLEGMKSDLSKASNEYLDMNKKIREAKKELKQIQEKKGQVAEELHDWENETRKAKKERNKEQSQYGKEDRAEREGTSSELYDREYEPRKAKKEQNKEQSQYSKDRAEREGTSSEPMNWSYT